MKWDEFFEKLKNDSCFSGYSFFHESYIECFIDDYEEAMKEIKELVDQEILIKGKASELLTESDITDVDLEPDDIVYVYKE